jgi:hypothetical protein
MLALSYVEGLSTSKAFVPHEYLLNMEHFPKY